jgi:pimeloyl-ACP methyl ester carboxylesterase
VYTLPSRLSKLLVLAMLLMSTPPAHAQQSVVSLSDFSVATIDGVHINVHHKVGPAPNKVPVLLVHGSWENGQIWDFPGRSVMDYLAVRGYDVYALDLRGMGGSVDPNFFTIDLLSRMKDVVAVAQYIAQNTQRLPVIMGWSQGGFITGLVAASNPQLFVGVGLLSVAPDGFSVPPNLTSALGQIISFPYALTPSQTQIQEIIFGTDPITGKSTISPDALATFVSPSYLQTDSALAILEEINLCPLFLTTCPVPTWANIKLPALVVDGALDLLVGANLSQVLFDSLGSANKQLIVFPRNSHGWFLEDNHDATVRVFDHFLSQF